METSRSPAAPPVWPDKLITQAEAFARAASWPVYAQCPDRGLPGDVSLYCGRADCGQAVGQLRRAMTVYNGSLDEMLSMVLRHMVMAHDVPLNTRSPDDGG